MATHTAKKRKSTSRRWSAGVTKHSNALDLDRDVFTWKDPHRIALSLKRSAERSHRRKSEPYRSAMSMLTFYINRAGHSLSAAQLRVLQRAKDDLRETFGKDSRPKVKSAKKAAAKKATAKKRSARSPHKTSARRHRSSTSSSR